MAETTFSMFSPPESRAVQAGLAFPRESRRPPQRLTEKYRPRFLSDVVGQGSAVLRMMDFLDAPYATAWLLSGPTGTGKSSLARALAAELGIDPEWGIHTVKAGECDGATVDKLMRDLRFRPFRGAWHMGLIDEADMMSTKAQTMFLSALEEIPGHALLVFTTNAAEKLQPRFRDRCEHIRFASDPGLLELDAQALFNQIWRSERLAGDPCPVSWLPNLVEDGAISFRRVVQAVEDCRHWRPTPPTAVASNGAKTAPSAKSRKS